MTFLGNPVILILLALFGVIIINLLLIASVQSHSKRTGGKTLKRLLGSIREPFQEGDSDLDKLADLVEKFESSENETNPHEST